MRAGIMVAVMKGMLTRMPVRADLPDYLGECRRSLCKFGIDQMMMALGLLRLSDHEAAFTAAALSPIFVYRAATGQVEAITVPGMMLGAEFDIPYEQARFPVHTGDRILLVTDGILEQPNAADDHFDAERCAACFREVGAREPEAIIDHLLLRLDSWRDTIAQRDDVTLVVLGARE
jgi:serine phosphatase RsbU (regulator of sigma subunit)